MKIQQRSPPRFGAFILLFSCGLLLSLGCTCSPASSAPAVGLQAPAFEASTLDNLRLRFPEDVAGKVVLLRFWAEQCQLCEKEMRKLEEMHQQHKAAGLVVLAVNAGQPHSQVAAFAQRLGLSYFVLVDEDNRVGKQYGVTGLPTSYVVDKRGVVRARFEGETPKTTLEENTLPLLGPSTS